MYSLCRRRPLLSSCSLLQVNALGLVADADSPLSSTPSHEAFVHHRATLGLLWGRRVSNFPIVAARASLPSLPRLHPLAPFLSAHEKFPNLIQSRSGSLSPGRESRGGGEKIRWGGELNEFGHDYAQIGGPIDKAVRDTISEGEIHKRIRERGRCRRAREFSKADNMREGLRRFGVYINDEARAWRADGEFWFPSSTTPRMSECQTIDEAIQSTHENLEHASPRDVAAFWTVAPRLLKDHQRSGEQRFLPELESIFDKTIDRMHTFGCRDLAQTALAFAKVKKSVGQGAKDGGGYCQFLRGAIDDSRASQGAGTLESVAEAAVPILSQFEPWYLSSLAYAFALAGYTPGFEDGSTLFDHIAEEIIHSLGGFDPQGLSNLLWAFVKAGASNPLLFEKVADHVVSLDDLGEFKPQELSSMVWAYAKAGARDPKLFDKVGNHIVSLDDLSAFYPQSIANTVWAFAKAEVLHNPLFRKVADHINSLNHLSAYKPQELSSMVWAYANVESLQPLIFDKVADHILSLENLKEYKEQEIHDLARAFSKAGVQNSQLFDVLTAAAIERQGAFAYQAKMAKYNSSHWRK
mmetsp:Transcript_22176/g.47701  ORF Transcript_22176/g.47701 Transcript_22176/m.47701 type:complete len:580 (-) Transcript_22176:26-1765(-)